MFPSREAIVNQQGLNKVEVRIKCSLQIHEVADLVEVRTIRDWGMIGYAVLAYIEGVEFHMKTLEHNHLTGHYSLRTEFEQKYLKKRSDGVWNRVLGLVDRAGAWAVIWDILREEKMN